MKTTLNVILKKTSSDRIWHNFAVVYFCLELKPVDLVKKTEERIYLVCTSNSIEDETHFLLKCNLYNNERQVLFRNVSIKHNQFQTSSESDKLKMLVIYVLHLFQLHLRNADHFFIHNLVFFKFNTFCQYLH